MGPTMGPMSLPAKQSPRMWPPDGCSWMWQPTDRPKHDRLRSDRLSATDRIRNGPLRSPRPNYPPRSARWSGSCGPSPRAKPHRRGDQLGPRRHSPSPRQKPKYPARAHGLPSRSALAPERGMERPSSLRAVSRTPDGIPEPPHPTDRRAPCRWPSCSERWRHCFRQSRNLPCLQGAREQARWSLARVSRHGEAARVCQVQSSRACRHGSNVSHARRDVFHRAVPASPQLASLRQLYRGRRQCPRIAAHDRGADRSADSSLNRGSRA